MGEEIAVKRVEGLFGMEGNLHPGLQNPLDKGVPVGTREPLPHPAKAVDDAADPRIGHAYHRQSCLHGAKLGIGEVLSGRHGVLEPSVVGQGHQELGAKLRRTACQITERVLEAYKGPSLIGFNESSSRAGPLPGSKS